MKYAVLTLPNGKSPSFLIFAGETEFEAINRAREWVAATSGDSRADWEDEHGAVSDKKWVKVMKECGFTITTAELQEGIPEWQRRRMPRTEQGVPNAE